MPIYSYSPQLFPVTHLLPSGHKEPQPFLPAVQRSDDDPKHLPLNHKQTQPLLPTVQRSADGSSNSRAAPHTHYRPEKPAREACAACRRGFVGGCLLGCRNSAKTASKILKLASEAAQTVRIFEAVLAEFRQPRRQPPTKPRRQEAHASRASLSRSSLSHKKRTGRHTPTRSQKTESQKSKNQKHSL